jgi:hypothetical protein
MLNELSISGFMLCAGAIEESSLERLLEACVPTAGAGQVRHPSGNTYGIRGLLWSSRTLRSELDRSGVSAVARDVLGESAIPIDAIFFDKQQDANWSVPGHQDRMMPVESGSGAAKAVRNGVSYADIALETLEGLLALRVHFDDVGPDDGALEVVPGSHHRGLLDAEALRAVSLDDYRPCHAARGDILALRPLLLHRSGRRTAVGHRRVLHVVYAASQPFEGPQWKALPP